MSGEYNNQSISETYPGSAVEASASEFDALQIEDDVEVFESFDDMGLKPEILRGIYGYGFEKPSAIQQRAITQIIKGGDVIAQAQSGTGKTATFVISVLQIIDCSKDMTQAIIVAPTRELAFQIQKVVLALGDYLGVKTHACTGGTKRREEIAVLTETRPQVIVGTPGRIFDMISRKAIDTSYLRMFVMDEADEMLSQGFKEQIYNIFQLIPPEVQTVMLSATMDEAVLKVTKNFMRQPKRILVKREEVTLEGIRQFYIKMRDDRDKFSVLCELYESMTVSQAVIFVGTRRRADELQDRLGKEDFTVSMIVSISS